MFFDPVAHCLLKGHSSHDGEQFITEPASFMFLYVVAGGFCFSLWGFYPRCYYTGAELDSSPLSHQLSIYWPLHCHLRVSYCLSHFTSPSQGLMVMKTNSGSSRQKLQFVADQ